MGNKNTLKEGAQDSVLIEVSLILQGSRADPKMGVFTSTAYANRIYYTANRNTYMIFKAQL